MISAKQILKKFTSRIIWLNLLGMLVVLVLLLFGVKWWLHAYTHHGESIEVPDLYGMDYLDAVDLLEEEGLTIHATDSTYIKNMPAGSIVVQTPAKGMAVKEGRTIYVTINSLTIPRVRIPDLIDNSSYREAQARLQQLEFRLLPPKLIDGAKEWVYGIQWEGQDLHTGDMVARESQLTLVIGNGSYEEDYDSEYSDDLDYYFDDLEPADGDEPAAESLRELLPAILNSNNE